MRRFCQTIAHWTCSLYCVYCTAILRACRDVARAYSRVTEDRLTALALMNIHHDILVDVDKVIDRFAKSIALWSSLLKVTYFERPITLLS